MTFKKHSAQDRIPQDWDAHLREKLLQMISDPNSPVVAFPVRRTVRKLGVRAPVPNASVPAPHDARVSNGVRLVMRKKSDRSKAATSLSLTLASALVVGLVVGGVAAQDRVSAYSQHLLASVTEAPAEANITVATSVTPLETPELAVAYTPAVQIGLPVFQ